MNNRTMAYIGRLASLAVDKITEFLIPKEANIRVLESFGPDGLFENIPRAENFDFETDKIKAIFNYKTTLCRQAIWAVKFQANKKLIRDFSLLLYEYILEELGDLDTFDNFSQPILIPIPSAPARTREKGFNQCILIARELIKIDKERNGNNFTLLENFLVKENDTEHQTKVSNRKKRLENLKNAFSINTKLDIRNSPLRLTKTNHYEGFSDIQHSDNHSESFLDARPGQTSGTALGAIRFPLSGESFPGGLANSSFIIIDDVITTGATMNEAFRALKTAGAKKIRGFSLAH